MRFSNGKPGEAERVPSDENLYSNYKAYSTVIEPIPHEYIPPIPPPSVLEIGTLCASLI